MTDDLDTAEDDAEEPPDLDAFRSDDPRDLPVRFSALKLINCPAKYKHALLTGREQSMKMKLGSAAHAAALEPHRIHLFLPGEFVDRKGKTRTHKGKRTGEAYELFKADRPADAVILTPREHRDAMGMAESLHSHQQASGLLFGPQVVREKQILWSHDGRVCSSTPDARVPGVQVTDLKTCRTADPERFKWDILRQGYREQLRMYEEADAYDVGEDFATRRSIDLFIVAVESTPPYVVQVYEMHVSAKRAADKVIGSWWANLRACEQTGHWPGYTQDAWPITDDNDENNHPGDDADDNDEELADL